ncbi:MAG TPA: signal peptide peptidase SppA [Alistipes sp.]|uniref:signal peptide peptidase SppA n=1 Tax=unclassified Alistipes TaxID=2608932 RepID=UPI0025884F43|nr:MULTISPECIES: signal peptide peptidase SppA [unclassified Alistipes]HUN13519.1 signal peptide peptidase SppA [Alistipes sp.]
MNFFKTFLAGVLAFLVGSFLSLFFWIFLFGMIAGMAASLNGGPVTVRPGSILKIDLAEEIVDSPSTDPFAAIDWMTMTSTKQLSLIKALRAIETAKDDDRIEGIYLRLNGGGGISGSAILEELRAAVVDFKESGKFVVSYNEVYSQGQYYLASAADSIYLQPQGGMDWTGLSSTLMFYKGLFDKLDLKAEIFRPTVCKYKSAVEPYILTKMSDANREQMQQLVNSLWKTIAEGVAESRRIDLAELNRIADGLEVSLPEEALEKKFVNGLLFEDQMEDVFAALGVETDKQGDYRFVSLGEYASQLPADTNFAAPQVAIVYAEGEIVDGEASGGTIGGNTMARTLAEVREDDDVKAVVLRVNSPGGSALASDLIWREMELLRAEKPVVVSMGSYAASGGYYISAPADVIVADKMTLTGSIGVFGMYIDKIDALKNKLGITLDGVKSNASAGAGTVAPLTPLERAAVMRGVDKVYETFTGYVAEGRNLPIEKVLDIAGGRVWSGEDALGIGLIDTYGGLKTAIALAADKAEIGGDYRVVEKVDQPTGLAAILASLEVRVRTLVSGSQLGVPEAELRQMREALNRQGVMMYSPYKVELR